MNENKLIPKIDIKNEDKKMMKVFADKQEAKGYSRGFVGYMIFVTDDGQTGVTKALNENYDLFILDLMLPGVDGFEICKQIREQKNTPIIMVSAKKDDIDKIRGLGL